MLSLRRLCIRSILSQRNLCSSKHIGPKYHPPSDDDEKIPEAPDPNMCCGQGCQNCVWIEYGTSLIDFYREKDLDYAIGQLSTKIKDPTIRMFVIGELERGR